MSEISWSRSQENKTHPLISNSDTVYITEFVKPGVKSFGCIWWVVASPHCVGRCLSRLCRFITLYVVASAAAIWNMKFIVRRLQFRCYDKNLFPRRFFFLIIGTSLASESHTPANVVRCGKGPVLLGANPSISPEEGYAAGVKKRLSISSLSRSRT